MGPVDSANNLKDKNLLMQARDQWLNGDWESLTRLDYKTLCEEPDRCKLALLAAAGHLQNQELDKARELVQLVQGWGCDSRLIGQILVASAYYTLGRAALASGKMEQAGKSFEEVIRIAMPGADVGIFGNAASLHETIKLGLLPQAAKLMQEQLVKIRRTGANRSNRLAMLEVEFDLLRQELLLAQQRQQLYGHGKGRADIDSNANEAQQEALRNKSVSQLGQDLWVLEKTDYKRGGFFVEVGATDGVLLSNTWLLEKEYGWRGICAEPNPKFFEQLKRNRNCKISDQYIGGITGKKVEFVMADVFGGAAEYANSDMHAGKRETYKEAGHVKTVESISLNDFLLQHGAPRDIDYISIDTEGSEYEILSTFPFDKWCVRLLTVEHNFTDNREKIRKLLEGNGYVRTEAEWDDWYQKAC